MVDLLDTKEISWGEYLVNLGRTRGLSLAGSKKDKDLPSSDFQAGKYVRKHSPLIFYDSVMKNDTRLAQIEKTRIKMLSDLTLIFKMMASRSGRGSRLTIKTAGVIRGFRTARGGYVNGWSHS